MTDRDAETGKEIMPLSWHVSVLGLYLVVVPFVFGFAGLYRWTLVVAGLLVAALAAWRSWQPDEKVPQPFVPLAVGLLGLYAIAAPFVFGKRRQRLRRPLAGTGARVRDPASARGAPNDAVARRIRDRTGTRCSYRTAESLRGQANQWHRASTVVNRGVGTRPAWSDAVLDRFWAAPLRSG